MHTQPVALVTGGSRGIGRGICQALARAGFAVAINFAANRAAAEETRQSLPPECASLVIQADMAHSGDRERMVEAILAQWDRIDVLVNNAGIPSLGRKDILEATEESWDRVLGVNLKGPYFLTQRVAKEMLARRDQLPRPTIVNISSISAFALSTNRGDYCLSKVGLSTLTQLFALRLADQGIRVFEVRPGLIATDMTAPARERYNRLIAEGILPQPRWGTPEDVGQAVALLVGPGLPYSSGDVLHVDGGFHLRRFQ